MFSGDVGCGVAGVEAGDEFDGVGSVGRFFGVGRWEEVGEEGLDVGGELGDGVVFAELVFADFVGFLPYGVFVEEAAGVDVFVEEDVEEVGSEEAAFGFEEALDGCGVDDDDVGSCGEVAADEAVCGGVEVLEAEHEAGAGAFVDVPDGLFDFFEDVDEVGSECFLVVDGVFHRGDS